MSHWRELIQNGGREMNPGEFRNYCFLPLGVERHGKEARAREW